MRVFARWYAELNEYLPEGQRYCRCEVPLDGPLTVREFLEQSAVPPDVVDLVVVNGTSVAFPHLLADGDHVSVYPVFESWDIAPLCMLRERPLRDPKFVLDVHLGKLASLLRMLGFDSLYERDATDDWLFRTAAADRRALLSKDRALLAREGLSRGYCVRSNDPPVQLEEVVDRFDLMGSASPFTRCLRCNARLESIPKADAASRVPPRVRDAYEEFFRCPDCDRVYWKGSHYGRMLALVLHLQQQPNRQKGQQAENIQE